MIVNVSEIDRNFVTFTVYSDDLSAARGAAVRAAHDYVFADGRSAEVSTSLVGRHGGAYVDGVSAVVRFS